jgi:hypothetical protein
MPNYAASMLPVTLMSHPSQQSAERYRRPSGDPGDRPDTAQQLVGA